MRSNGKSRSRNFTNSTRPAALLVAALAGLTVSCGPNASTDLKTLSGGDNTPTSGAENSNVTGKVIYGDDNRRDLYEEADPALRELADSTVALISKTDLIDQNGRVQIKGTSYGDSYHLCAEEPFREQDTAAFCSGFLVAPDKIVTAGHCVTNAVDCEKTSFVFGYAYRAAGVAPTEVASNEVYNCQNVIHTQQPAFGADFAVIQLDRPVTGHRVLALRQTGQIQVGDEIVVMGHPAGLPLKIADGAKVRNSNPTGYFVANLDTYGGNSGSAVFNMKTLEVEGVLVRGAQDFRWSPKQCNESYKCTDEGCRGEDVTRITEVLPYLASQPLLTRNQ